MERSKKSRWRMRLVIFLGLLVFLWLLLKYTERKQMFYPLRGIEMTPGNAGMEYEDVFFSTSDGATLNAWFVKADSSRGVVLFCHGNAGNISHRLDTILLFNRMNMDVFIFDYRGYGRSSGILTEKGAYADASAAYHFLTVTRGIPPTRIVLFGRSMGGNVAIDLSTKVKTACLISESAFSSIEEMAKSIYGVRPPRWLLSNHFDAVSRIPRVDIPKLIIHSRDDEIVPFSQGESLFEAANEPKHFFELAGSHNEAFLRAGSAYEEALERFIERYLAEAGSDPD